MSSPTSPKSPVSTRSRIERRTSTQLDEELLSTAQDILNSCPRFRILVLGKTGAGKSSLINAAFNVELANVSHGRAGVSDINQEITSENNSRFVLHDSQGFAPGEVDNFNIVRTFIEDRAKMPQMKDKLHAIWFCMEIPTEGGALFEVADQQFLELPLGDVPIIVVFTKYDLLVRKFEREAEIDLDSFDEDEFDARNAAQAEEVFQTTCVGPLTDIRMGSVPYMKVSKHPQYKSSLAQLVELTQENIDKAVWLIWALAQRASADVKIQASIEVGKKKYWRGLASSLFFPGKTLIKCLSAIHRDIVIVWNFNDPNAYLEREKFKAIMSHLVEDLVDLKPKSTNSTQISAGTVASVAVALAGGLPISAPIVIPIGAGLIFAQWVYMVYQETPGVIRGLMGYIVDLTIVMQSLFWLVQASDGVNAVRPKLIKLAVKAYLDSGDRARVHEEIKAFVTSSTAFKIGQKDRVLEKVVQLIHSHRFVPPDDFKDIAQQSVNILDEEEGWA